MAKMDEVVAFAHEFAKREHELEVAQWRERDEAAFQEQVAAVAGDLFDPGLGLRINRGALNDAYFAMGDEQVAQRKPRIVFRVDRWTHPELGELWGIYVSSTVKASQTLFSRYFVRDTGKGLRLVGQQNVCRDCMGTGEVDGRVCPNCRGTGWIHRGGEKIGDPGKLEESRVLHEWKKP